MSLLAVRDPAPVVEPASTLTRALFEGISLPCRRSHNADESPRSTWSLVREPEAGMVQARLLSAADAAAFQACRLEALTLDPCAFAAAFEEEAARSLDEVAARLGQGAAFGAFIDGALVGTAGFAMPPLQKKCHKGLVWGVYVRPAARGRGLGRLLVGQVIEHALDRVEQLHATVVTTAAAARHLYRQLGFQTYGLEPRGLKVSDQYFDQELMVKLLR
jgi:ribosomal protein S18 acetylase RimI-like enzyme